MQGSCDDARVSRSLGIRPVHQETILHAQVLNLLLQLARPLLFLSSELNQGWKQPVDSLPRHAAQLQRIPHVGGQEPVVLTPELGPGDSHIEATLRRAYPAQEHGDCTRVMDRGRADREGLQCTEWLERGLRGGYLGPGCVDVQPEEAEERAVRCKGEERTQIKRERVVEDEERFRIEHEVFEMRPLARQVLDLVERDPKGVFVHELKGAQVWKGEEGFDGVVRELLVLGEIPGEDFVIQLYVEFGQAPTSLGKRGEKGVDLGGCVICVRVDVERGDAGRGETGAKEAVEIVYSGGQVELA